MRRKFVLAAVLVLMASGAQAASYLDIFGTVHDPFLEVGIFSIPHQYSGPNLEPGVVAPGADLYYANLWDADLSGADLSGANLTNVWLVNADLGNANLGNANLGNADLGYADLGNANLGNADLGYADLGYSDLRYADLSGANLGHAYRLGTTTGSAYYNASTNFTDTGFDPVAAGWNLVPEPNTALLVGIGLAGMAARRRV